MPQLSAKQVIYQELVSWTLIYLRNRASQSNGQKWRDRSPSFELELIHNLPISMFDEDFGPHDIWFLNNQAKEYFTHCSPDISPMYTKQLGHIADLFALVPDAMRGELSWAGPAAPAITPAYAPVPRSIL